MTESGANGANEEATLTYQLRTKPAPDETVYLPIESAQPDEILVNGQPKVTLQFTEADWDDATHTAKAKTVKLKSVEDFKRESGSAASVRITAGATFSSNKDDAYSYNKSRNYSVSAPGVNYVSPITDKLSVLIDNIDSQAEKDAPTGADAPSKVAGLTAQTGSQSVVLTWAPNPEAGVTYEIYGFSLNGAEILYGTTTATSFTVTGLENGVSYVFRVRAVSGDRAGAKSDAVNVRPSIVLGTETENLSSQLNVFPNPTTGTFTLRLEDVRTSKMQIVLTDISGRQLLSNSYGSVSGEFQADLVMENTPAGMYVLSVITDNGTYRTKVMLVNR